MAAPLSSCGCRQLGKLSPFILSRPISVVPTRLQHTAVETSPSDDSEPLKKIVVPKRKKRDPTAILKVLSDTVGKDYNAPHYKYIDDPFLIPTSNLDKRAFSLAKASGQRAAQFVVSEYPHLFTDNVHEPKIEAFMPKPAGFQHGADTVEGLLERIKARKPKEAFEAYEELVAADVPLEQGVQEELLELLCVYNCENKPDSLMPDEQWFKRDISQDNTGKIRRTWKDKGPAEQVFEGLPDKNSTAYCSLIRGMAKFYQTDRAWELFTEMRHHKMQLDVQTYNTILSITSFFKESAHEQWELSQDILQYMKEDGVAPNVDTFNSVLYALFRRNRWRDCKKWSLQVINEMRDLGIEPTARTWHYFLCTHYSDNEISNNMILHDVIKELEGKEFTLTHPEDAEFMFTAMLKCCVNLKDIDLAYKIDSLLNTGKNSKLMMEGFKEQGYFTHFLRLLCTFENVDVIMDHYERLTPHVYTPNYQVFVDILQAIDLHESYHYLPQMWSDMVLYGYSNKTDLLEILLTIMAKKKQGTQLQDQYMKICDVLLEKAEEDPRGFIRPLQLTGALFGSMLQICLHGDGMDKAWEVFQTYRQNKTKTAGMPSEESLATLCNACIDKGDMNKTMLVLTQMSSMAYPKTEELIEKAIEKLNPSEEDKNKLNDLL